MVFAPHAGGATSDCAERTRPSDTAVIGGPRGSTIIPDHLDWYLQAGDATALPARQALSAQWVSDAAALHAAARSAAFPAGRGCAGGAGEAGAMAPLRDVLLVERGLPRTHVKVSAYWKPGASVP